ncbi:MAG: hypothetical protein LBH01_01165 [Verrucomicrobiales bacterium]|jgi:hypothetical protein|nr:hypothetical protein [Verrucomicrobiales bacterium]
MLSKILLGVLLVTGLMTVAIPLHAAVQAPSSVGAHCDDVDNTAQDSFE